MFDKIKSKIKNNLDGKKETTKKVLNVTDIKDNFEYIKEMTGNLLPKKDNKKEELSFGEIVLKNKLTQLDIEKLYFSYAVSFYICSTFLLISFLGAIYSGFFNNTFVGFLLGISMSFVFLANMFRFSFYCYKIKKKKLCKAKEWYNDPGNWLPKLNLK